jgi:hypothetical protein
MAQGSNFSFIDYFFLNSQIIIYSGAGWPKRPQSEQTALAMNKVSSQSLTLNRTINL